MANLLYDNFYLQNETEDQYNSMLNLQNFCTIDNTLVGTAGMVKEINRYKATDGVEKLEMGVGNTKTMEVSFTEEEYRIALAQGRFKYFDEEQMKDPYAINVGIRHAAIDMFNTVNKDVFAEFNKTTQIVSTSALNFDAFADAQSMLNVETLQQVPTFAFVNAKDMAKLRKGLKDSLQYVEAFVKNGYVGTVAGVNIYAKKDAVENTIIMGTQQAVTVFNKKGTEIELDRTVNSRENWYYVRKYYVAALVDDTKAVKITIA